MALRRVYDRREAALAIAFSIGLIAIAAAWLFELVGGYVPCKLCLQQRWPYYIGVPLALAGLLTIQREGGVDIGRAIAAVLLVTFVISAGLGVYHAGAEWKFWPGPTDCGGRIVEGPAAVTDFRATLEKARTVRCDEAPWRFLGLSFAGWNVVISLMIAAFARRATTRAM